MSCSKSAASLWIHDKVKRHWGHENELTWKISSPKSASSSWSAILRCMASASCASSTCGSTSSPSNSIILKRRFSRSLIFLFGIYAIWKYKTQNHGYNFINIFGLCFRLIQFLSASVIYNDYMYYYDSFYMNYKSKYERSLKVGTVKH